jgi:glycine/D-amino acid oxidase-like deaminating enzyme
MNEPVWESGRGPALRSLDDDIEADVCVVGLGGSGLAAIAEAQRHGASVVGLDSGRVASGAAGRNGGFLLAGGALTHHRAVETLGRARAVRMYGLTLAEMARIEVETPDLIRRVGSVRIASSPEEEADCEAHRRSLLDDGFRAEAYNGPEGRGTLFPDDGAFDPLARCRALAATAAAGGARLFESSAAMSIGSGLVATRAAEVRCGAVVVAVDGGLEEVVPALVGRVRSARLQMLATEPATDMQMARPVYARWGYDYWQQLPDGRIALGGCRDVALEAEWGQPPVPSERVQAALDRTLRDVIGTQAAVTHRWAGRSAYTADLLPVLEEVAPRVWVVGGYSGHGNVVGALYGRAATQLALTGSTDLAF